MKIDGSFVFGIRRYRSVMTLAAMCLWAGVCLARIDRIDIFDKADNKILFVTFQFDAAGKNIGRDIFTADSTFLRHTSFTFNAQNQITKESSINFDSNLVFSTNISSSGTSSTFSVFDQFNLDQLGGPISSSTSDQVTYNISQGGTVINKIKYTLGSGGSVTRIDVGDNTGAMLYYALTGSTSISLNPGFQFSETRRPTVAPLGRGHFKITCNLSQPSNLVLDMFNGSGRRVAVVLNKQYGAGAHSIIVDAAAPQFKTVGNGAYIIRLSIDGKQVVNMLSIIQK